MRRVIFTVSLAAAVVFALLGGVVPPESMPRSWQTWWGVPVVQTDGLPSEKKFAAAKSRILVGREIKAKSGKGELKLSESTNRKELALTASRTDGRAQYRAAMFFWMGFFLAIAILCIPWSQAGNYSSSTTNAAAFNSSGSVGSPGSSFLPAGSIPSAPASGGNGGGSSKSGASSPAAATGSKGSGAASAVAEPKTDQKETGFGRPEKFCSSSTGKTTEGKECKPCPVMTFVMSTISSLSLVVATLTRELSTVRAEAMATAQAKAEATATARAEATATADVSAEPKSEDIGHTQTQEAESPVDADLTLTWTVMKPCQVNDAWELKKDTRVLKLEGSKLAEAAEVAIKLKGIRSEGMPSDVEVIMI